MPEKKPQARSSTSKLPNSSPEDIRQRCKGIINWALTTNPNFDLVFIESILFQVERNDVELTDRQIKSIKTIICKFNIDWERHV